MKVLVDGDIIAYRVGFASQHTYYDIWRMEDVEPDGEAGEYAVMPSAKEPQKSFDDAKSANKWLKEQTEFEPDSIIRMPRVEVEPLENCLHSVNLVMGSIAHRYGDDLEVYFSCPTKENWRTEFYPEYKANRPDRKPFYAEEIRAHLERKWKCITEEGWEADDLIAIVADWYNGLDPVAELVVVSIDKDMLQIPGLHYNWVKEEEQYVNNEQAAMSLAAQVIAGDSTDNIKGIPGWGEAAAREFLNQPFDECPVDFVYDAYGMVYGSQAEAYASYCLNRALVTLPRDEHERDQLVRLVHESQAKQEAAANSEAGSEGAEDSTESASEAS